MAYAILADMVSRYGEDELIGLTATRDQELDTIDQGKVASALAVASDQMDTYLRRRYLVPVAGPSPSLVQACCSIARYMLAVNSENSPTEQMRADRKDAFSWLSDLNAGKATLDGAIPANTTDTFSRIATRPAGFHPGRLY